MRRMQILLALVTISLANTGNAQQTVRGVRYELTCPGIQR